MSQAREDILAAIAAAHGRTPGSAMSEAVRARLRNPPLPPAPAWQEAPQARFLRRLQKAAASVDVVDDLPGATQAITAFLGREQTRAPLVLAPHPMLQALRLPGEQRQRLDGDACIAVSVAFAGVAETGSLALLSQPQTPTRFNFLPEALICLLESAHIVTTLEALWQKLRREHGALPRAVNLVTGPSRTADVEQTIQLGAHGPRQLHVVVVERAP